ncbi:MAG TPA: ATP-dependent RNA helicase HrpA, partial [Mariprofundaceae bacterium]|nr:ATP-dependent RNA helicase HrpA [Mariprofundaceae bacterium]
SANQRAGRCGRVAAGICFRLYSEENFNNRPEHTDPEIRRTNLANVILQMISLGLGDIHKFDFMQPPEKRSIQDGYKLLEELQAIDDQQMITQQGKQLTRLPIDPRLGRMVLQANQERSLHEVLIIVAALSVQDPKIRPSDKQQKADEKHSVFTDKTSDFLSWLKLWNWYHEQRKHLSKSQLRKTCTQHFLSYLRMREWVDLHGQLLGISRELKLTPNKEEAKPDAIHKAMLAGLLSHVIKKREETKKGEAPFIGARGLQVTLFPGSPLNKKPLRWLMAGALMETSRLFARDLAPIDPVWLEGLAAHLLKRTYSEPHWSKKRAQVCAYETVTLYGLPIISRRVVHFGMIEPEVSRDLFIRHALVHQEFQSFGKWFKHNQKLLAEIENMEAISRRRDLMHDEQVRFDFFAAIIPEHVCSGKLFEKWRKKSEHDNPKLLFLSKEVLLQDENAGIDSKQFPTHLATNGLKLKLNYHFDPTHHADGITVTVPIMALGQLKAEAFEWLVLGLLEEKITALIKGLPKTLRKNFVPAPQFAEACAGNMPFGEGSLLLALSRELQRMTGIYIPTQDWDVDKLPAHLFIKFEIRDKNNKVIDTSHQLGLLQKQYAHLARVDTAEHKQTPIKLQQNITRWDFGELPEVVTTQKHGMSIAQFPALEDKQDSVSIALMESEAAAYQSTRQGIKRLLMLSLHQQADLLRKNMPKQKELALYYVSLGKAEDLRESIISQTFEQIFLQSLESFPRNEKDFQMLLDKGRAKVVKAGQNIAEQVLEALQSYAELQQKLASIKATALTPVVQDIQQHMQYLIYPDFVQHTPAQWLAHLPRFIQAALLRLDKAGQNLNQDQTNTAILQQFWQQYQQQKEQRETHNEDIAELVEFRWLLEELRVSMFAQSLKTSVPVSVKRLEKRWTQLTR